MQPTEIDRLAAALNGLRPDWPAGALRTFIENELATRAYRDAALALTFIACDPETRTPRRVLSPGPWWDTTRQTEAGPKPDRGRPCTKCGHYRDDHPKLPWRCDYTDRPNPTRGTPMPDTLKTMLAEQRRNRANPDKRHNAPNPGNLGPRTNVDPTLRGNTHPGLPTPRSGDPDGPPEQERKP